MKTACLTAALALTGGLFVSCGKTGTEPAPSISNPAPVETAGEQDPVESNSPKETENINFMEKTMVVNGRTNKVFVLLIDITGGKATVSPYLSFNRIYGFQTLSEMALETDAYAAVNGGFFFEFGRPSGLVVVNGETISPGTGKYESIIWDRDGARFEKVGTSVKIKADGIEFTADRYNEPYNENETAVFSSAYGGSDRKTHERRVVAIENGVAANVYATDQQASIPEDGYIVCFPMETKGVSALRGKAVEVEFNPDFRKDAMAYECATMLVKDGESMAGDIMPWVGNLNNYDPRTCVGITNDGRLGFVVIDGRQPGYSSGATGRETADIMIELGFKDASMLDGGASSEMIVGGEIVNRPSGMGTERIIAGGFLIFKSD